MIRFRCGDDQREVSVRPKGDALEVTVDGQPFHLTVEVAGPGVFVLRNGSGVETFHCVREGSVVHLSWRGTAYRLEREDEAAARTGPRHVAGGLEAPMPGKVIKVGVTPGQKVRKGEEVLVVEAMKMENALRAPRDGTVKTVSARVGEMVSPGAVLVELE